MASLARLAGELVIDHSNSPGIPADLAAEWAAQGVAVAGEGQKLELATFTCAHCNAIVIIRPERTRPREVCRKCMKVVCDNHNLWCRPFAQILEKVLTQALRVDPTTNLLLPRGSR